MGLFAFRRAQEKHEAVVKAAASMPVKAKRKSSSKKSNGSINRRDSGLSDGQQLHHTE